MVLQLGADEHEGGNTLLRYSKQKGGREIPVHLWLRVRLKLLDDVEGHLHFTVTL
jgi:hypothetical protein